MGKFFRHISTFAFGLIFFFAVVATPSQNVKAQVYSSPLSTGINYPQDPGSGGGLAYCGRQCGTGNYCPTGLSCNRQGICVLSCCLNNNKCKDPCALCPTGIMGNKEFSVYLFAFLLIIIGLLTYKLNFFMVSASLAYQGFKKIGGIYLTSMFSEEDRKVIDDRKKKFEKEQKKETGSSFEKRF